MLASVPGDRDAARVAVRDPATQTTADLRRLADEQAALRRVAELVAVGASQSKVFDAVASEACHLLGGHFTALLRYEPDGPAVIVSMHGADAVKHVMHVGMRLPLDGDGVVQRVQRTARTARVDNYAGVPGSNAATARDLALTSGVGAPIIIEGRPWGAITVLGSGPPLPSSAEARLEMFAKLVATAISNAQARTNLAGLADEQTALRRVAELVARGVTASELFDTVAVEASRLLDGQAMTLTRFEGDRELVVVADRGGPAPPGTQISFEALTLPDWVRREGRVVRVDDYTRERDAQLAAEFGLAAAVAAPIAVEGEVWGMLTATSDAGPIPAGVEGRLQEFAKLVSAALANSQARADVQALADEQAALRHVAELVARGAPLDEVFAAVATEASKLLGETATALLRYDSDDVATAVATCNSPAPPADLARQPSVGAGVGVPITVEGRVWGSLSASTPGRAVPAGTEEGLAQLAELAAAAIANAENKAKLTASRARVVATADETRRRLQRDLHDGAQQRLVHTLITLRRAKDAAAAGQAAAGLIDEALDYAERANRELRDLVRGILPASLTRGGLVTAVESLVSDIPIPIDTHVATPRLPTHTETTAYFIVAEALTNVVKHAHASHGTVTVRLEHHTLSIEVRDDGSGGANPAHGTGLTGLLDRIEASDGALTITSPPQIGTRLHATLPIGDLDDDSRPTGPGPISG